jgi:DNA processing protein
LQNQENLLYTLALTFIPGIGNINARKILTEFEGGPKAFFDARPKRHEPTSYILQNLREFGRSSLRQAEQELRFMERADIEALLFTDLDYPNRLKSCHDAPVILFGKGNLDMNARRTVAIVGTRKATEYGRQVCIELVEELHKAECTLISGLAHGIDSFAHKEAERLGIQNIGVLAHGLDQIYPSVNKGLSERMLQNGGVISDYTSGTKPDRENFPRRNRIIAGMADATIVVEAMQKGGALITADIAFSYNRDVFAVPGRWGDEASEGCLNIIRQLKAQVLAKPTDLIQQMQWEERKKSSRAIQKSLFPELSEEEETCIQILHQHGALHLDELAIHAQRSVSQISSILLTLEFKGMIKSLPGKQYALL